MENNENKKKEKRQMIKITLKGKKEHFLESLINKNSYLIVNFLKIT